MFQGCILWHNWWPLLTGLASCLGATRLCLHLAHIEGLLQLDLLGKQVCCLQRSCMFLCPCLTYSSGQTLHPQLQYMEAVAWPAGERTV